MPTSKTIRDAQPLDPVDATLVRLLQHNGRMSNSELAQRAGIAPSTSVARLRSLIDRGVITGFTANVAPAALGFDLEVLVSVSVRAGARQRIAELSDELQRLPQVLQLFFLGGAEDFIIHIAARSSQEVRDFVLEHLSAHPAVASTRTSIVFNHFSNGPSLSPDQ